MAIVLAIIGIALVSVLQGRELIASAQYKSFKGALADYSEAFHVFRERYHALPGDFAGANADLGQPDGNGDGVIDDGPACSTAGDESCRAWRHLRAAALLKGDRDAVGISASPQHPYDGVVSGFFTGNAGNGEFQHKMYLTDLPIRIASRLDEDLDDGRCNSGRITSQNGCDGIDWDTGVNAADLIYAL